MFLWRKNKKKYQYFSAEKSTLSEAMSIHMYEEPVSSLYYNTGAQIWLYFSSFTIYGSQEKKIILSYVPLLCFIADMCIIV